MSLIVLIMVFSHIWKCAIGQKEHILESDELDLNPQLYCRSLSKLFNYHGPYFPSLERWLYLFPKKTWEWDEDNTVTGAHFSPIASFSGVIFLPMAANHNLVMSKELMESKLYKQHSLSGNNNHFYV